MKKLFLIVSLFATAAYGAEPVAEAPIKEVGTPATISISSTTLTKVPTNPNSTGRTGIYIRNPSTNPSNMAGFFGNCTSTALASTIQPFVIVTSSSTASQLVPIREDVCLWLISLDVTNASAVLHYQEIKR